MRPPPLSEETRRAALEKAAMVRRRRAKLKEDLKVGAISLSEVLSGSADEVVASTKVSSILESMPGVGKIRAGKIMERLDIASSRRVRGLGAKQKEALLKEFGSR